jgi:hypothetical protein
MKRVLRTLPEPLRLASRRWRLTLQHRLGEIRRWWDGHPRGPEAVLLILGCQRSGTTMLTRVFGRDPEARVFGEYSVLSARDRRNQLRLAPLDEVARRLQESRYPLVVMKPLVESQRADALLAALPRARGLWLVRNPADVARSNLERFGRRNGVRNLERLLSARPGDWRAERVPDDVRETIRRHFSMSMDPMDAAALFWWARNRCFFALGLEGRADVMPVRYEWLVERPVDAMSTVYAFAGRPFPGPAIVGEVSTGSVGRESLDRISKPVLDLCLPLLERFDELIARRSACA